MAERIYPRTVNGKTYYYLQRSWREKLDPHTTGKTRGSGKSRVRTEKIYLARIIHAPLLPRSSPQKQRRHVCDQAPDERFSSWDRSGVTRFHVSALCQGLFRTASRRTSILVRHHHHGSNEVKPTGALAIKASGTVRCRRDSLAPGHRALSRERNSESEI